jgi:hypothetical protein
VFGLLGTVSCAVFMITTLITHHFSLQQQFNDAMASWSQFGSEKEAARPSFLPPFPSPRKEIAALQVVVSSRWNPCVNSELSAMANGERH